MSERFKELCSPVVYWLAISLPMGAMVLWCPDTSKIVVPGWAWAVIACLIAAGLRWWWKTR